MRVRAKPKQPREFPGLLLIFTAVCGDFLTVGGPGSSEFLSPVPGRRDNLMRLS